MHLKRILQKRSFCSGIIIFMLTMRLLRRNGNGTLLIKTNPTERRTLISELHVGVPVFVVCYYILSIFLTGLRVNRASMTCGNVEFVLYFATSYARLSRKSLITNSISCLSKMLFKPISYLNRNTHKSYLGILRIFFYYICQWTSYFHWRIFCLFACLTLAAK